MKNRDLGHLLLFILGVFLLSDLVNTAGTNGQSPLLVSDYPSAFRSNALVVVGDGFPHGPKGERSSTIDGLCGAWIAVKLAEYYEAPSVVFDSDITRWEGKTVDLIDRSHNLIVVGCHWVNIVAYHYFFMRRDLVSVYPANYLNDDPLVFPEFLVKKSTGERFAYWKDIENKKRTSDYAVMVALKDGERNVLILWSYYMDGTIAMAKILENINLAGQYGWRLNSEAVFVTWNDKIDDDKVQLEEITVQPLFERTQTTTYSYAKTTFTFTLTKTATTTSISSVTQTVTVKAEPPPDRRCLIASLMPVAVIHPLRSFRDSSVHVTFCGSSFMEAFDVFYYSVSPTVTSLVTRCSLLCAFIEALLYPMIWTLRFASVVFDALSFMPELAMIVSGLVASALISVTYATPLIVFTRKRSYQYRWER